MKPAVGQVWRLTRLSEQLEGRSRARRAPSQRKTVVAELCCHFSRRGARLWAGNTRESVFRVDRGGDGSADDGEAGGSRTGEGTAASDSDDGRQRSDYGSARRGKEQW